LNPQAKIIIHEHGYSEGYVRCNGTSGGRFYQMLRGCYGIADGVVAISQAQADWILEHRLTTAAKLTLIRQCPPLQGFFQVPAKLPARPLVLGAYGRFCPQKGFAVLLRAMQQITHLPIQLHLGGTGDLEGEMHQMAAQLTRVEWVGRVDDVPAFLQGCDGVVIPSLWEPWGNVCLEAKAAGRPVIASRVDGLIEQAEGFGLLVPPQDPTALAEAMTQLLQFPPEQLQNWGTKGRAAVAGSWETYIAAWGDFLWQQLANPEQFTRSKTA
jgi:glycosyltransferase involved in cell wall biosynthesis